MVGSVTMLEIATEEEPILTSLATFLNIKKLNREKPSREVNYSLQTQVLINDIVKLCVDYNKATKTVYPLISFGDIIYNQKTLKPVLGRIGLIYHALGMGKNSVKTIEMKLAMEPTP
jgi:hypothetical protein